jgi:hypothetical protein
VPHRIKLISSNPMDPCDPAISRTCPLHTES